MGSMMGSLRLLALVVVLAPALATAQPSAKDKQQASDLVKKAIAKSQAGEHEIAAQLYLDAYKIIPQPLLLSNIGSEYQQLDKPVEALKYFCKYIEADPTGANVSYALAQARTLYVDLGGEASVEDSALCKPIVKPEPVTPTTTPQLTTEPEPAPQPGPTDGPKSSTSPLRYIGLGVAVVGAGAFGLGTYYGLQAKKISDEITNHKVNDPWPANIKAREAEGKSDEKKQIGFMIGGGVAIAAGITMIILGGSHSSDEARVSVTPIATSDTLGFAAAGRF
jgi:tetratricopeptide (TPR) repeat protein